MVSSRKSYDPNQFLHYPENNPFSDAAQKRLNSLVEDFLRTGIVFANGAGVHQVQRKASIEEQQSVLSNGNDTQRIFNGIKALEMTRYDDDDEEEEEEDSEEEYIPEFPKIDKGKGREIIDTNTDDMLSIRSGSDDDDDAEGDRDYEEVVDGNLIGIGDTYVFDEDYMDFEEEEEDGRHEEDEYTEDANEKQYVINGSAFVEDEYEEAIYDEGSEGDEYSYDMITDSRVPEPRGLQQSPEHEVILLSDDDDDDG